MGIISDSACSTTLLCASALLCILIVYVYMGIKRRNNYWKRGNVKCMESTWSHMMDLLLQRKNQGDLNLDLYRAFPNERYHGVMLFFQPSLMLRDPELIKQVTIKEFDHFTDHRGFAAPHSDPFWNPNLLEAGGQHWRALRATLSPTFTSSKMHIMFHLMEECANQYIQHFQQQQGDIIEVEMSDTCRRYTNDVIATTAFGLKCNSFEEKGNDFYLKGLDATHLGGTRILRFILHATLPTICKVFQIRFIPKYIADYFSEIIKDAIKTREEKNIIRPDMLHLLMQARQGQLQQHEQESKFTDHSFASTIESDTIKNARKLDITVDDIIAQAFIFFFAGFESVANSLTFILYELLVNEDIQDKLRDEINTIQDGITYEKLLSMKYLDMVVSEGLRKWPIAITGDRKVTKTFTIQPERPGESPVVLEEGTICWLPMYGIHRDPNYYPDPEKFDPERFSDENKHKIQSGTYIPFGSGPRSCIGSRFALLESKLFIYYTLKNFQLVPIVGKTQIPLVLDPKKAGLGVKGGLWVGLKKIAP